MYVVGIRNALLYLLSNAEEFEYEGYATKVFYTPPLRKFGKYIEEIIQLEESNTFVFYFKEPYMAWHYIFGQCICVRSAGLVVFYEDPEAYSREVLMIYRRDKWDFPKGKIELNETPEECALREFKEECGVEDGIDISQLRFLTRSYYLIQQPGRNTGKEVKWFGVKLNHKIDKFNPQKDEDITQVAWIKKEEAPLVMVNTYPIIRDILFRFLIHDEEWGREFYTPKSRL